MNKENLSFEKLPQAVQLLSKELREIKNLLNLSTLKDNNKSRVPLSIDQASEIIQKAKPTIYTLVRNGKIPSYKRGKQLYFFEDELIEWIESGKKASMEDILTSINKSASNRSF